MSTESRFDTGEVGVSDVYASNYRTSHEGAKSRSREWTQAKLAWAESQLEMADRDAAGWLGRVHGLRDALAEKGAHKPASNIPDPADDVIDEHDQHPR